jgi:hypothetical protein
VATDNVYIPNDGAIAALAAWLASVVGPATARLYDNNLPYLPTRVLADYNEASFAGYAPIVGVAWGVIFLNIAGKAESDSPALNWTFTAGAGTQPVFGIYFTDNPATKLQAVVPFSTPFVFAPANRNMSKLVQLTDVSEL